MAKQYIGANLSPWSFAWMKARLTRHITDMLRLSLPIIFSRLAGYFMVIVDTIMVTRYSKEHASWLVFGEAPAIAFTGGCIGFTVGVSILVSRFYGAKKYKKAGNVWRQGLIWSILTGALLTISCITLAKPMMQYLGNASLIPKAYPITIFYALSFIPLMIWMTGNGFLEATRNPLYVFVFSIVANVCNVILNWILIYGHLGFNEMGAYGSALATLIMRIIVAIGICLFIYNAKFAQKYKIKKLFIGAFHCWKELRILGYSAAGAIIAELAGFAILGLLSTRTPLSVDDTNSWAITLRVLATLFMVALGLSAATSVRVGVARGRKDFNDQMFAILIGSLMTFSALFIIGIFAVIYAQPIARIFSNDIGIITLSSSLISYLIWVFIPDGLQATLGQSMRTSGIVWITTNLSIFIYGIMLPIFGYYFTFSLGHGVKGFFEAIMITSWLITLAYLFVILFKFKDMKVTTTYIG